MDTGYETVTAHDVIKADVAQAKDTVTMAQPARPQRQESAPPDRSGGQGASHRNSPNGTAGPRACWLAHWDTGEDRHIATLGTTGRCSK